MSSQPFRLSAALEREHPAAPYERRREDPLYRPLRIFTQDPSASRFDAAVATVRVPYEPLKHSRGASGQERLSGALFVVEAGRDAGGQRLSAIDLNLPLYQLDAGPAPSTTVLGFAQAMTYAVATLTYQRFQRALGREPDFAFADPEPGRPSRLRLCPRGLAEANAFYSRESRSLEFGSFSAVAGAPGRIQGGMTIHAALSHDIVVHETTHALLDGMRPHFFLPTHPDVLALHEGLADLVALFLRFSYREVVERALITANGTIDGRLLTDLARQFSQGLAGRDQPLRSAIFDPLHTLSYSDPQLRREEHALGEVLVKAVFDAFAAVYQRKTESLRRLARQGGWREGEPLSQELVSLLAQAASRLAEQFLNIIIRAIDYCPPVDCCFGEYLRAMITADYDIVPEDPWGYREALVTSFRRLGITVPLVQDLSEEALRWEGPELGKVGPVPGLAFQELQQEPQPGQTASVAERRRRGEALGKYVTRSECLWYFGLACPDGPGGAVEPPIVESIRSLRRLGPDGDLSFDLVAEVVQRRWVEGQGWFYGGSTLIIDHEGKVRYKISKQVESDRRLEAQRAFHRGRPELAKVSAAASPSPDALLRRLHRYRQPEGA